jgi:hypothetical protein
MTDQVNTIHLMDDTEIKVRPLKISLLKPFLKEFKGLEKVAESDEKSMDVLLNCVQIAFKQYAPELSEDRAKIEDMIDLPTIYKIIDVASGINLTDTSSSLLGSVTK